MIYAKPPFFHLPRNAIIGAITSVNHGILIPENVKYGDKTVAVPTVRNVVNRNNQLRPTLKEPLAHPSHNFAHEPFFLLLFTFLFFCSIMPCTL